MITRLKCECFTAFDNLDISFSPGVNIIIGENGTGKTHILKAIYSACDITRSKKNFAEKINNVFYPSGKQLGRLVKRSQGSSNAFVEIARNINSGKDMVLRLSFSNHTTSSDGAKVNGSARWAEVPMESVFIPVKDMMANAPGFRSLYSLRNLSFEEIYADIIDRAFLPALKGPMDKDRSRLMEILQKAIDGKVVTKNEEFFLKNKQGELEFTLLAEGFRKLGLLLLLIQNGTLLNGSALFWDEPETNLNPRLQQTVVSILLELQRLGVQIFIATHDYVLLKEFDLVLCKDDNVQFHTLYRDKKTGAICHNSSKSLDNLEPNAIDSTC